MIMKVGSIILASISMVLLLIYGSDVAIKTMFKNIFLRIDEYPGDCFLAAQR